MRWLLLVLLAGCAAPSDLPLWGEDVPRWVEGEQWVYSVNLTAQASFEHAARLEVTVIDDHATLDGKAVYVADWHWIGHRFGNSEFTWRVWHAKEDLAWVAANIPDSDGPAETFSGCPIIAIFPGVDAETRCSGTQAGLPVEYDTRVHDLGWGVLETPIGPLAAKQLQYETGYGDTFGGAYAPDIGHWGRIDMFPPQPMDKSNPARHDLIGYTNPRMGVTLGGSPGSA